MNLVNKILFGILSESFNHNFAFHLLIPNFTHSYSSVGDWWNSHYQRITLTVIPSGSNKECLVLRFIFIYVVLGIKLVIRKVWRYKSGNRIRKSIDYLLGLMPLSAIFQLYHGDQFYWWKNPQYPERTTDRLYHLRVWVECTLFVIYKAGRERTPYWW